MSLISDALKKAELQRAQPPLARESRWNQGTHARSSPTEPPSRSGSRGLFVANVAVLAIVCIAAIYFLRNEPMAGNSDGAVVDEGDRQETATSEFASDDSNTTTSSTFENESTSGPLPESPFLPPDSTAASQPPVTEEYDLGGTSTLGSNTLLSVVRRSDRRSLWIPVGKTVGEITAVSYDPETDQAVIRVRGNLLSVTMRNFMLDPAETPSADNSEPEPETAE